MPAFGSIVEIHQLLSRYGSRPTELLKKKLATMLVHQGWRYDTTEIAVEFLIRKARVSAEFLSETIDLILFLCTADLVQIFPNQDFYANESKATRASAKFCEPPEIAEDISKIAIDFAPHVGIVFPKIVGELGRASALQFMHCFLRNRQRLLDCVIASSLSSGQSEKLAAACIISLMQRPVNIARRLSPVQSYMLSHDNVSFEISAADICTIESPVMNGAWEIALIGGAISSGSLDELIGLVSLLDEWRRDDFSVALRKWEG